MNLLKKIKKAVLTGLGYFLGGLIAVGIFLAVIIGLMLASVLIVLFFKYFIFPFIP